jgi:hypothetical protein
VDNEWIIDEGIDLRYWNGLAPADELLFLLNRQIFRSLAF